MPPLPELPARRVIVAITGASGAAIGLRLLDALAATPAIESHLLVSPAGWLTIQAETGVGREAVEARAAFVHPIRDIGATLASGSFEVEAMIIAPCSMRTLAAIATGLSDNLITRAAEVTLKERRRLVLAPREAPLTLVHLRNMSTVTEMGGIICPPVPAFYQCPATIAELIDHLAGRLLAAAGLPQTLSPTWNGLRSESVPVRRT